MITPAWQLLVFGAVLILPLASVAQQPGPGMLVVRATTKTPDETIKAVQKYSEDKGWLYLEADKLGPVTLLKICIPEVGQLLWPLGLQIGALLPCGKLSVYQKEGKTEIALLHPAYMQAIYPHAEVKKAVAIATPLLMDMLVAVAK